MIFYALKIECWIQKWSFSKNGHFLPALIEMSERLLILVNSTDKEGKIYS